MSKRVLVLGASGQIGTDLTIALRQKYGAYNVIATDIREPKTDLGEGPFFIIDALDIVQLEELLWDERIDDVYNLVAMLSANAEKHIWKAWDLNMKSLFNTLNLLKDKKFKKLFWPSSIAVFGPNLPENSADQFTVTEPQTVYGISKLAGERWCEYFAKNYDVDVRSIRYPGLISYKGEPGGGTTDYAVEIFHAALNGQTYKCFLDENRKLPMMYMEDGIRATIDIMEAPRKSIKIRSSYNVNAMTFDPKQLFNEIKKETTDLEIDYQPDVRDTYAQSWPAYINDDRAAQDWGWKAKYDLSEIVNDMLNNLKTIVL